MDCLPKKSEVLLDEEIEKQEFVKIINSIYKQECYIYAVIPEWEEELFNELSNDFIIINKIRFTLTRIFPRTIGFLGYVKDKKNNIYIRILLTVYNNGFFSVFRDGCISTFNILNGEELRYLQHI
ncbi:hypothetical protein [Peribacillus butanolivorans]|uniref:hypothetical protein n=1 Tax=Peribacillus butanolivorans TaxID=421767 RepID=UPI00367338AB